ncbi:MAG TPA: DUF1116 domain-containing protein [Nocardioidaceae bacterium]|nr:DUF1116 domain-containing protein [Nocardioidaceae bacterium]
MAASTAARSIDGVDHVAAGMVDPLNLLVIRGRHGYDLDAHGELNPGDLVIAVRAETEETADRAIDTLERSLADDRGDRQVVDVGPYVFAGERRGRKVERVSWRPASRPEPVAALSRLEPLAERIAEANDVVVRRMQEARPVVVGVGTAGELLPGMTPHTFLHAGPPIDWPDMSGPLRGAIIGAALFEGLASNVEEAVQKAKSGQFEFAPGHERAALGPMAGVITSSMPMWIVENDAHHNQVHTTFSEGQDEIVRFGGYQPAVIERLQWMRSVLLPVLAAVVARLPVPLDLRALSVSAVEMGDEVHNRNRAATSTLLRTLAPVLVELDEPKSVVADVARFIAHDYFPLNLSMASAKATADAASGVEYSTIVTTMARNGTEFGLRTSGTGDRWFTAPSGRINGLYRPGYTAADANPDMGDSTITETIGLGGFAMASAPGISRVLPITAEDAVQATLAMYDITWAESVNYRIPILGYRGTPLGIDCRKVVESGIVPAVNTGIAHKQPGVGVIGTGVVRLPMAPFVAAVEALVERLPHDSRSAVR